MSISYAHPMIGAPGTRLSDKDWDIASTRGRDFTSVERALLASRANRNFQNQITSEQPRFGSYAAPLPVVPDSEINIDLQALQHTGAQQSKSPKNVRVIGIGSSPLDAVLGSNWRIVVNDDKTDEKPGAKFLRENEADRKELQQLFVAADRDEDGCVAGRIARKGRPKRDSALNLVAFWQEVELIRSTNRAATLSMQDIQKMVESGHDLVVMYTQGPEALARKLTMAPPHLDPNAQPVLIAVPRNPNADIIVSNIPDDVQGPAGTDISTLRDMIGLPFRLVNQDLKTTLFNAIRKAQPNALTFH